VPVARAYGAAFGQLGDARVRGVIARVVLLTLVTFGAMAWGLWLAVSQIDPSTAFDTIPIAWLQSMLEWLLGRLIWVLGGFVFLVVLWLLFAATAQFYASFYLERVAAAVEARHYPGLAPPRTAPVWETVTGTVRFFLAMVAINLVAIPFYLIPGIGPIAFFLVNGYLLGREYFELMAERRLVAAEMRRARRLHRGPILVAGLIATGLFTLPVVNLLAPIVAAAAMVHIVQGLTRTAATTG